MMEGEEPRAPHTAGSPDSGMYSAIPRTTSFEQEVIEERERVAIEFNLSADEIDGLSDLESGVLSSEHQSTTESPVLIEQDQKNWTEFGYDLDYAETPDEVVSQVSEDAAPLSSAAIGVVGGGGTKSIFGVSSVPTHTVVTNMSKYTIDKTDSATTVTKTSTGDHSPVPVMEIENRPIKMNFESFLSDNGDDVNADDIVDIWSSAVRCLGIMANPSLAVKQVPVSGETNYRAAPSENSGDDSDCRIKEHGSTICGVRTRSLILVCAFVICTAMLVVGVSVLVSKAVDRGDGSEQSLSDTFPMDDFGASTTNPSTLGPTTLDSETVTDATVATTAAEQSPNVDPTSPESLLRTPTIIPTVVPTSVCRDRDTITFDVNGSTRNCEWVRKFTQYDFQLSICQWNIPIRNACRTTCNTCDAFEPTTSPTLAPTGAPISPTRVPTGAPTITTQTPTQMPIAAGPTADCQPDLPGNPPGELFTCNWLSMTNSRHIEVQCAVDAVRNHCRETCGDCEST